MNTNGKFQNLRDFVLIVVALGMFGIFAYREFYPKASEPDRVETTALAYLKVQPQSLADLATAIDSGGVKANGAVTIDEAVGTFLKTAHSKAANDLAAAFKDANYSSAAIRRAAASQTKGLR